MSQDGRENSYFENKDKCDSCKVNIDVQYEGCNNYFYNEQEKATYGYYSSVEKLREIVQLFRDNKTQVIIFSEHINLTYGNMFYIHDVVRDVAYVSINEDTTPDFFIPLSKIVSILAVKKYPKVEKDIIKEEIITINSESAERKKFCCASEIGDIVRNIRNFTDNFPISLPSTNEINKFLALLICYIYPSPSVYVNNEFVFYHKTFFESNGIKSSNYLIIPTCKIEGIARGNLSSQSEQHIQSMLKSKNRDEIFEEISENLNRKSFNQMINTIIGKE